jgi:hypothetical protein
MKIDIIRIDNTKGINNTNAVLSTSVTGRSSTLSVRPNYPGDLTIENIQNKFSEKFDDVTYYTIGINTLIGA